MSPKEPQLEKHEKLLKAAEELFNKFGIKKVSIQEICQMAGVSKMTFYKYYKNKIEIAKAMLRRMMDESYQLMDEIDERAITFPQKLREFLRLKEEYIKRLSPEFIAEYVYQIPEMQEFFQQMSAEAYQRFADFIVRAQGRGEVRQNIKPELLIAVLNSLMELAKNEGLVNLYPNYTDFVMEVNNFFYYGILPTKD